MTSIFSHLNIYIEHLSSTFTTITTYLTSKLTLATGILAYSFFFDIDKAQLMTALACLVVFDFLSGLYAAKITGVVIESRKAVKTAIKFAVYCLLVSASHLTNVAMNIPELLSLNIESLMIGFLAATEMISIIENAGKAGYVIPKKLLNKLKEFTNNK